MEGFHEWELGLETIGMSCRFLPFQTTQETTKDIISDDPETEGAMLVPVILGSDKTMVSVATGQNEYYPLYISSGQVHNNVRRAHRGAVSICAFLAIPRSMFFLPSVHAQAVYTSWQPIASLVKAQISENSVDSCFIPR